ncbi:hypothetical protein ABE41_008710 [Fictibacillus arsenicus]|uniref:Glycosyltransferase 2-like domain-containing protein n=1 Tax=Fictibacillus arsenicus TaxID=255247 RepID=A0A1B1Z407_9BACL|nr:glycosyltransferase [Fictibacillus arsenicus]ANX12086.1 hypothetical protein ABE41_008710 [Fictibacillus arsenicus]
MTVTDPLVSVIIPFYNCRYIGQSIESVLKQTYSNIELIVVNDGSTEHQHLITPYLSRVVYIEKANKGAASALNEGIKKAKGEYLVWLSSDDIINPFKIEYQLKFMKSRNSFICFTNFNKVDKDNQIIKYNSGIHYKSNLEIIIAFKTYNPINGCTVMMSKKVVDTIGYFNEALRYTQDYEFWMRVAFHFPIDYYHITLTNQRIHEEMGTKRHLSEILNEFKIVNNNYKKSLEELIRKMQGA